MPWAVVAAGIGAVGAMSAADSNANAADNATAAQSRIADGQAKLGQDQLDFNKQMHGAAYQRCGMVIGVDVLHQPAAGLDNSALGVHLVCDEMVLDADAHPL